MEIRHTHYPTKDLFHPFISAYKFLTFYSITIPFKYTPFSYFSNKLIYLSFEKNKQEVKKNENHKER